MNTNFSISDYERLTDDSADIYLYKHRVRTNIIYIITLCFITIIIILLPFIYVDITISAIGNIRPIAEKTIVTASISELVDSVYVKEGSKLKKGDIILTQRSIKNRYQQDYHNDIIHDIDVRVQDLQQLVSDKVPITFASISIHDDYNHYQSQRQQIETVLEQKTIEWKRNKNLFDAGFISESEYNEYYYQYTSKKNELTTLDSNQKNTWQRELFNLRKELKEYSSIDKELKTDKHLYELRSPVSGSLDQFSGIYKGSNISAGQQIAIISPNGGLCLEVYIAPRDIAFINEGQSVTIQIEALNYNEWGTLHGMVTEISSDLIDNGNGFFYYKVKCSLERDYLTLRNNGHRAYIKKGMNARAHFVLTKQSLFTLMYKNIDEWANPTQYNPTI